jgi:hypothetical protein
LSVDHFLHLLFIRSTAKRCLNCRVLHRAQSDDELDNNDDEQGGRLMINCGENYAMPETAANAVEQAALNCNISRHPRSSSGHFCGAFIPQLAAKN